MTDIVNYTVVRPRIHSGRPTYDQLPYGRCFVWPDKEDKVCMKLSAAQGNTYVYLATGDTIQLTDVARYNLLVIPIETVVSLEPRFNG